MFGFQSARRSDRLAREKREKANREMLVRHRANLDAERGVAASDPPSRKKAGFGKRTIQLF
jgi:hypothetical protein